LRKEKKTITILTVAKTEKSGHTNSKEVAELTKPSTYRSYGNEEGQKEEHTVC